MKKSHHFDEDLLFFFLFSLLHDAADQRRLTDRLCSTLDFFLTDPQFPSFSHILER